MNSIADIARSITTGTDIRADVARIRQQLSVREAILYLTGYPSGKTEFQASQETHPREVIDNIGTAIHLLAAEQPTVLVDLLEAELETPSPHYFSFTFAWALAHVNYIGAINSFVQGLKHENKYVRWACCEGLKRLQSPSTVPALNQAASDRAALVRGCAVEALKIFGDESSLPILKNRLEDPYSGIKKAAQEAIQRINRKESTA